MQEKSDELWQKHLSQIEIAETYPSKSIIFQENFQNFLKSLKSYATAFEPEEYLFFIYLQSKKYNDLGKVYEAQFLITLVLLHWRTTKLNLSNFQQLIIYLQAYAVFKNEQKSWSYRLKKLELYQLTDAPPAILNDNIKSFFIDLELHDVTLEKPQLEVFAPLVTTSVYQIFAQLNPKINPEIIQLLLNSFFKVSTAILTTTPSTDYAYVLAVLFIKYQQKIPSLIDPSLLADLLLEVRKKLLVINEVQKNNLLSAIRKTFIKIKKPHVKITDILHTGTKPLEDELISVISCETKKCLNVDSTSRESLSYLQKEFTTYIQWVETLIAYQYMIEQNFFSSTFKNMEPIKIYVDPETLVKMKKWLIQIILLIDLQHPVIKIEPPEITTEAPLQLVAKKRKTQTATQKPRNKAHKTQQVLVSTTPVTFFEKNQPEKEPLKPYQLAFKKNPELLKQYEKILEAFAEANKTKSLSKKINLLRKVKKSNSVLLESIKTKNLPELQAYLLINKIEIILQQIPLHNNHKQQQNFYQSIQSTFNELQNLINKFDIKSVIYEDLTNQKGLLESHLENNIRITNIVNEALQDFFQTVPADDSTKKPGEIEEALESEKKEAIEILNPIKKLLPTESSNSKAYNPIPVNNPTNPFTFLPPPPPPVMSVAIPVDFMTHELIIYLSYVIYDVFKKKDNFELKQTSNNMFEIHIFSPLVESSYAKAAVKVNDSYIVRHCCAPLSKDKLCYAIFCKPQYSWLQSILQSVACSLKEQVEFEEQIKHNNIEVAYLSFGMT